MADRKEVTRVRLLKGLAIVKRGRTGYAERCTHGVQTRWSLGTRDPDEATRKAILGAAHERPGQELRSQFRRLGVTVRQILEKFAKWHKARRAPRG